MEPPHPAIAGFERNAEAYERGRPEYPAAAIAELAERIGLRPGRTVLDLAAGTGKMTRAVRATGARVIAAELTRGMRTVFRRRLGPADLVAARAEALPFSAAAFDAVVVAQAFHWFAGPPALEEVARVLRPNGGFGLVWNRRDETVGWVRRLGQLVEAQAGAIPRARPSVWRPAFTTRAARERFTPLRRAEFSLVQPASPETVVDRFTSVSAIGTLSDADRASFAEAVREELERDPATRGRATVEIPYRTEVYWCRRRPRSGAG